MQNAKNIPTINCIILGEISLETYKVEIVCPGGGTHTHGLSKKEVETKSHRVDNCGHCKNGYNLYLHKNEVLVWNQHK